MKCPKCGDPVMVLGRDGCQNCGESFIKKSNPSPQMIFAHIGQHPYVSYNYGRGEDPRNACERKAFDEFMEEYKYHVWDRPLPLEHMEKIKKEHPNWYKWLQDKGLVQKKVVKKQAWVNAYKKDSMVVSHTWKSQKEALSRQDYMEADGYEYLKTILLHEWEEDEP